MHSQVKSSILEALYDFNLGQKISDRAIPIEDDSRKPQISICFSASNAEIATCLLDANIDYEDDIPDESEFVITKTYPQSFTVSSEFQKCLPSDYSSEFIENIENLHAVLNSEIFKSSLKSLNLPLPIADGIAYVDLQILSERLSKFSRKGKAKVLKRKRVFLTDSDGVIRKNEDGGLIRKGHSDYHTLKTELADGYERLSYFAKSMTKRLIPNRKKCYLVCRLSNALAAQRPEL